MRTAGPVTASRNFFPIIKDLLRDRGRRRRLQSAARAQPLLRQLVAIGSTRVRVRSQVLVAMAGTAFARGKNGPKSDGHTEPANLRDPDSS